MEGCTYYTIPFAEGRIRAAYKGVMTAPPEDKGREIVVKKPKNSSYAILLHTLEIDKKTAKKAQELAQQFNIASGTSTPIRFQEPVEMETIDEEREPVLVEYYLYGKYTKWISNNGWINSKEASGNELMPAFAHWTWVKSRGQHLVCDLQGVEGNPRGYHLTDPAIHSLTREYGQTDLGKRGIDLFFQTHVCNSVCRSLGVQNNTPKPTTQNLEALLSLIGNQLGTSYEGELPQLLQQFLQTAGQQWKDLPTRQSRLRRLQNPGLPYGRAPGSEFRTTYRN